MKRTKKQKIKAISRHVNSQLGYKFEGSYNLSSEKESVKSTTDSKYLGSIKKELYKSLIIALLILTSLVVIYWVS
ncbi:MAG: hypothetical protein ACD_19C00429G0007 [uncultured bacterium]|nr:MAG: hypothetical protein ACD_19C00429G0007 [uncultured bacterium]